MKKMTSLHNHNLKHWYIGGTDSHQITNHQYLLQFRNCPNEKKNPKKSSESGQPCGDSVHLYKVTDITFALSQQARLSPPLQVICQTQRSNNSLRTMFHIALFSLFVHVCWQSSWMSACRSQMAAISQRSEVTITQFSLRVLHIPLC